MARSHFSGPIRIEDGVQVATSRNATGTEIITSGGWLSGVGNLNASSMVASNVTLGGGTKITQFKVYSASLASGACAANSITQSSFTITGLTTSDKVLAVIPPVSGITSGVGGTALGIAYALISAADTLAIGFLNPTASAVNRVTATYTVVTLRS